MTLAEKIIARAAGRNSVSPGDEVWVDVDLAIMNDSSGPRRFAELFTKELGGKVWDPERVVIASDHFFPAANLRHAEILSVTRKWALEQGIRHFYEFEGVLHNLLLERRIVRPGMFLAGADSHTTTAGAAGVVATPIGSTELATVLATGRMWVSVPESVAITLRGRLRPGVLARDLDLAILARLKSDFALYKAVEFNGPALAGFDMDSRSVLTNAGIEMGAECALVHPDQVSWDYAGGPVDAGLTSDIDATYAERHAFELDDIEPQVAVPHQVDTGVSVSQVAGQELDVAYLGSCVGGKLSDLRLAAGVLEGKRTRIPLLVTPATREVYDTALADGTLQTLASAGAIIQAAGCGACAGLHSGVLGNGQRLIGSVTRNFKGRMGSRDAKVFLGSPLTVAASAIEGHIADPRPYLEASTRHSEEA